MTTEKPSKHTLARAGEHRVLSELIIRGYEPFSAENDKGIDIILRNGLKVDVKAIIGSVHHMKVTPRSPGNRTYSYDNMEYAFQIHKTQRDKEIDFYIAWIAELDEFYIIPSKALTKSDQQKVYPNNPEHRYSQYKAAWHLLK